jgi:O-antigen/teichoic acid export membrane protein/CelD/BcsL family acetyltransferase involved in cellulose biosynthesis
MSVLPTEPKPSWTSAMSDVRAQLAGLLLAGDVRRNALAVFTIRVASAGLLFLSQIILARWIGAEHYGTYVALWSLVLVLGGLSHCGLGVAMMRLVPEYLASNKFDLARGILRGGRILAFLGGLISATVGGLIVWLLVPDLSKEMMMAITLALACVPMFALTEAQDGIGRGQSWTLAGVTPPYILRPLLVLAFAGAAYWADLPATAVTAIGAAALATAITALTQTMMIGRRIAETVPGGSSTFEFKDWFKVSLPLLAVAGSELILQNADVLMLHLLRSPGEVGIYYAAAKTTTLALFVHYAIGSAYSGRFADANARNDQSELKRLIHESVAWTFWPSLLVTVIVLATGPYLLGLFGPGFKDAYPAMFIISVGLVVRAATGPSEFVLNMLGRQSDCARSFMTAAAVSIALNLALVPLFGMLGAATASATAFATAAILNWRTARRELGINLFVFGTDPASVAPGLVSTLSTPATAPVTGLSFAIVRDLEGFEQLEVEWDELYTRAGTDAQIFLSYDWNRNWIETYHARHAHPFGTELAIVVGRRNGRAVIIWPLLRQRLIGLTYLSWIGQPVTQYCDILADASARTPEIFAECWQQIRSNLAPDVVALRKVRDDATIAPYLSTIGGVTTLSSAAPYVDFKGSTSFEDFETRYSARTRKNRRRLRRRLQEQGTVAFLHRDGSSGAQALAQRAIELKRAWIDARGLISPALHDQRMEMFFANECKVGTNCLVSALTLDDKPIAIMVSVAGRSRLAGHIFAYDVAHEKSGAGVLLLEECLRVALERGFKTYDLLAPGDAYKYDWCADSAGVHDWAVPVSLRGRIYTRLYLSGMREQMKRAAAKLPARWRHQISLMLADVDEPRSTRNQGRS